MSRGQGQSAIAAAAYRSGDKLTDEMTGDVKHYPARSARILFAGIFVPKDAPAWSRNRNSLWNEVHRIEGRKDSTLARELEVALPHELTDQQRLWLIKDFVREAFTRRGLVVDVAIHAPDAGGDRRNFHAHLLFPERVVSADGFASTKDRSLGQKATLYAWRKQWAQLVNRHLERHGHAARIDPRSLKGQGITDRKPTIHLGPLATQMERRGVASMRGDQARAIKFRNDLRADLWRHHKRKVFTHQFAVAARPAPPSSADNGTGKREARHSGSWTPYRIAPTPVPGLAAVKHAQAQRQETQGAYRRAHEALAQVMTDSGWPDDMRRELQACRTPVDHRLWAEKWAGHLSGEIAVASRPLCLSTVTRHRVHSEQ